MLNKKHYTLLLFIIALTCIVYYPSLHYAFQFDDGPNILKFFSIRHLSFSDLFLSSTRWICFWINATLYKIGQFDPFYYRLVNLSFHIFTGILIFLFTLVCLRNFNSHPSTNSPRALALSLSKGASTKIALMVTALFLLHPVQTQTVSYIIQGQLEGLSALFIMSMLLCAIFILRTPHAHPAVPAIAKGDGRERSRRTRNLLIVLFSVLTILSTGSKEIIVVTPFLILLTDWFFVSLGSWQAFKRHLWLPLLNVSLIVTTYVYIKPWFLLRMLNLNYVCGNNPGNVITQNPQEAITIGPFCVSQFKVLLHYLWIYIWPFNISLEYDWKLTNLASFDFIFPFIIIVTIWGLIIYLLRRNKTSLIAFGLLWFFLVNAPRASIIPCSELVADYKTYLASFGWLLVIALLVVKFIDFIAVRLDGAKRVERCERWGKYFYLILILISCSLGYLTYQRNKVWQSGLEFWHNIIQNAPNKARAYNNYATELAKLGRFKESVPYFKRAIRLEGATYHDPYTNLAGAYAVLGDTNLAIDTLCESLKINSVQPEAYNNLGAFYLHKQDFDKAEEYFKTALNLKPHYGKAMYNLGKLNLAKGDYEVAWQYFKQACHESDIDNDLPPLVAYAEMSVNLNKIDDAEFACKRIIAVSPNSQEAKIAQDVLKDLR